MKSFNCGETINSDSRIILTVCKQTDSAQSAWAIEHIDCIFP